MINYEALLKKIIEELTNEIRSAEGMEKAAIQDGFPKQAVNARHEAIGMKWALRLMKIAMTDAGIA